MKTIWKYQVDLDNIDDNFYMPMKSGAEIISVAAQYDILCLWAIVDPDQQNTRRLLYIRGTGHPLLAAEDTQYLGTAHLANGLVFHVFDGGWES